MKFDKEGKRKEEVTEWRCGLGQRFTKLLNLGDTRELVEEHKGKIQRKNEDSSEKKGNPQILRWQEWIGPDRLHFYKERYSTPLRQK